MLAFVLQGVRVAHRMTPTIACHERSALRSSLNSKFMPCKGLDVAGNQDWAGMCPHFPGACVENDEFSLGVCYKECALLARRERVLAQLRGCQLLPLQQPSRVL